MDREYNRRDGHCPSAEKRCGKVIPHRSASLQMQITRHCLPCAKGEKATRDLTRDGTFETKCSGVDTSRSSFAASDGGIVGVVNRVPSLLRMTSFNCYDIVGDVDLDVPQSSTTDPVSSQTPRFLQSTHHITFRLQLRHRDVATLLHRPATIRSWDAVIGFFLRLATKTKSHPSYG